MAKRKRRKAANGAGSVFQRGDGRWVAVLTVYEKDGKKSRVSRIGKSKEDAQDKLDQLREGHSFTEKPSGNTVGAMLDRYFRDCVDGELARNTVDSYRFARSFLTDLEVWDVKRLQPVDIADWMGEIKKSVGGNSIRKAKNLLGRAYQYAIQLSLVAMNPCRDVKGPKGGRTKPTVFDDEQVDAILKAATDHPYEPLILMALTAGPRQGEMFGLRLRDVDFDSMSVRFERQVIETKGKVYFREYTKTSSSMRTVALTVPTVEALNVRRKEMLKDKRARPDDLIFTAPGGGMISRTNFADRVWRPFLRKLQVPVKGLHTCRHTCASMMLRRGIPVIDVAQILGHASPEITMSLYAQYVPKNDRLAAEKMSDLGATKALKQHGG